MFKYIQKPFSVLLLLLAVISMSSCSTTLPPPEHIVEVNIDSRNDTNAGRLMYVIIRSLNRKNYIQEGYNEASKRVFADPPDTTVLTQKVIFPGEKVTLTLDDKRKDIAIYCFFTNPGKAWKAFIPFNPKTDTHYIKLGAHDIQSISNFKLYTSYFDFLDIFDFF